ncbi:hypothetical protein CUU64_09650 [Bacillus sp. V5-8f]|nr:hypothetical protein CUU64_09650 [Bacillus sp. V5-8f]
MKDKNSESGKLNVLRGMLVDIVWDLADILGDWLIYPRFDSYFIDFAKLSLYIQDFEVSYWI